MCRARFCLLSLSVFLSTIAIADPDGKGQRNDSDIYDEVETIIAAASDEVRANHETFTQVNDKTLGSARGELNRLIVRLNEERRFGLAKEVQDELVSLPDTVRKRAVIRVPGVMPPKTPLLKRMVGKWNRTEDPFYYVVLENGTVEQRREPGHRVVHTTTLTIVDDETAEFTVKGDWRWRCKMAGNDTVAVFEFDPKGKRHGDGIALERIKTK